MVSIEMGLFISILALLCSFVFNMISNRRAAKQDAEQEKQRQAQKQQRQAQEASGMTTVVMKLENIGDDVKEIKSDLRGVKEENKELRERVVINEQSTKQAHKRIDEVIRMQG